MIFTRSHEEFFEHLMPVLKREGLMQTEYQPGTLREKLFDVSTSDISERHPVHGYRGMFCG